MNKRQPRNYEILDWDFDPASKASGHQETRMGNFQSTATRANRWVGVKRFFRGFVHLYAEMRFSLHRVSERVLGRYGLSWVKVGLAALGLFILFKDDLNFTIDLRGLAGAGQNAVSSDIGVEKMSVAQSVSLTRTPDVYQPVRAEELDDIAVRSYIKRFALVAKMESEKFGIPASIKMAQALIESEAGRAVPAQELNNHFGAAMHGQLFESAWTNWRAHSIFLQENFPELFEQEKDYRDWAKVLGKSGYSRTRNYGKRLIEVVEKYQLQQLDNV